MLVRAGGVAVVVGSVIGVGVLGATALREKNANRNRAATAPATRDLASAETPAAVVDSPAGSAAAQQGELAGAPLTPIIPMGESSLGDGLSVIRSDTGVTVTFDTPLTRTRIPEKFERFVRGTLPLIYGRGVDSLLAMVPEGGIASQGDLITELPARGARIPAGEFWSIRILPETRPGLDGPLVVRYRVAVVPHGD